LSQAIWAKRVGITQQAWNNYERDFRRITPESAMQLCRATGVSMDWIYRGMTSFLSAELAIKLSSPKNSETDTN
jgi:transcriptional regulator with XRE-family HTH domain